MGCSWRCESSHRRELSAGIWHHDIQGRVRCRRAQRSPRTSSVGLSGDEGGLRDRRQSTGGPEEWGGGEGKEGKGERGSCFFAGDTLLERYKSQQSQQTGTSVRPNLKVSPDPQGRLSSRSDPGTPSRWPATVLLLASPGVVWFCARLAGSHPLCEGFHCRTQNARWRFSPS